MKVIPVLTVLTLVAASALVGCGDDDDTTEMDTSAPDASVAMDSGAANDAGSECSPVGTSCDENPCCEGLDCLGMVTPSGTQQVCVNTSGG